MVGNIIPGHKAQTIVRYAKEGGLDLIVLGHGGHHGWGRFAGSTADKVVDHAPYTVWSLNRMRSLKETRNG